MTRILLALTFFALLSGCAGLPSGAAPAEEAFLQAAQAGFRPALFREGPLQLSALLRLEERGQPVRIYIEGDGRAWVTARMPSQDPTPRVPLALLLALRDNAPNVAYFGRPCQYAARRSDTACRSDYWTSRRFAPEVVSSYLPAVRDVLRQAGSTEVDIVGYSGGGTVALLVAARLAETGSEVSEVSELVRVRSVTTVAGVLDPAAWTAHHGDAPLTGSLSPVEAADQLRLIPQRHFVGARDRVVPLSVARSYEGAFPDGACLDIAVVPGASHTDGWIDMWQDALRLPPPACAVPGL